MKKITLCMMLLSPLISGQVMAEEKVTSAKQVSTVGIQLQKELQALYLVMKTNADANKAETTSPQRQIMTELETYNKQLNALQREAAQNTHVTKTKWQAIDQSLTKIKRLTSLNESSFDRAIRNSLNTWVDAAQSYGSSTEKYAILSNTKSSTASLNAVHVGGAVNGSLNLVVEDYSLGLDTPQDRVEFVEWLTKIRADENRILARGGFTTPGGLTNRFPAAYVYSNGSYGNTTTFGRRDRLTPIYNNQRQPIRRRTQPRYNFVIK